MFLLGLVFGSVQFVPQSSGIIPALFIVYILPFPSFFHFIDHVCEIHGCLAALSAF
jgi:hypothetical protein